ncbi:hypothetical protein B9Q08_06160 [Candidatus Marsarchaeota G2 archaeon ECH_B_SAG-M15]|uniref:Uncharacterized protein n=1 Tax=Candidatus Marsarchaeota G2 archaeon ECH_B_SAG-M15 TaxID=1978162 RepID=A0A2R6ATW1_9ARCH|nr:MAG: hypothetical protein B9Q08_06160 [Candidatus Marsarchaeota G2 archaeon ECH_B_SAG-M15]
MTVNVKVWYVIIMVIIVVTAVVSSLVVLGQGSTHIILDLLGGQQYFGASYVHLGDNGGTPSAAWPVYYNQTDASLYWGTASKNQPVLDLLVAAPYNFAGAMFWPVYYNGGSSLTITLIGAYTQATSPVSDGFEVYLFLTPTKWGISSEYNYSFPYWFSRGQAIMSPVAGDVILSQSSNEYIAVEWDAYWQYGYRTSGASGQWNVWLVNNTNGSSANIYPNPSSNLGSGYAGWDGIGTGYFQPNPGDYIRITVTYDPKVNMLSGYAYDMNTSQWANFTLNLNGYYTLPRDGNYIFGVGASIGTAEYANWALLYAATQGLMPIPSPSTPNIILYLITASILIVIFIVVVIVFVRGRRH